MKKLSLILLSLVALLVLLSCNQPVATGFESVSEGIAKTVPAAPAWDASTAYVGGDLVLYDSIIWKAKWWTQGDVPGSSEWGPWELYMVPPPMYTLNVGYVAGSSEGRIELDPPGGEYYAGTVVTLSGYGVSLGAHWYTTFGEWMGDINSTENPLTIVVDSNKSILANFILHHIPTPTVTPTIYVTPTVPPTPTPVTPAWNAATQYSAGDKVTHNGWKWIAQIASLGEEPGVSTSGAWLKGDQIYYIITAKMVGTTSGASLSTSPWSYNGYPSGSTVTFKAINGPATVFSHWSGDASGSENPLIVIADGDKEIFANFVTATPTPPVTVTITPTFTPTATLTSTPTVPPTPTHTPTCTCPTYPAWESSAVYNGGDIVYHNGMDWQAEWWTTGEEPGTTGEWGVWRAIGI